MKTVTDRLNRWAKGSDKPVCGHPLRALVYLKIPEIYCSQCRKTNQTGKPGARFWKKL